MLKILIRPSALLSLAFLLFSIPVISQVTAQATTQEIDIRSLQWLPESHKFWVEEDTGIIVSDIENPNDRTVILSKSDISKAGLITSISDIIWTEDRSAILIYTNTRRVWRANTRGDYWYFDLKTKMGKKLGKKQPESSLQFAKFSPDGKQVAFVSKNNIYVENVSSDRVTALTKDGTSRIINGTFDWAYEEELGVRDGFRWSPDGKNIAFWRIDATSIRNHIIINNTDSLYPFISEIEYPKPGDRPSEAKIGSVNIATGKTTWMKVPGEANNNYIPRMDWSSANEIMILQLNRTQNEAHFYICNAQTGKANEIYNEKMELGWISPFDPMAWDEPWWLWSDDQKFFLRTKEKDGWLRVYKVSRDGKDVQLLTQKPYDANLIHYDSEAGIVYYIASPDDATQRYLYAVNVDGTNDHRVTPEEFTGTNVYLFSPDGKYALHINSNINRLNNYRLVSLPNHVKMYPKSNVDFVKPNYNFTVEKFSVTTEDGVSLDGTISKPLDFDPNKKYPVLFYVYGEPASSIAMDKPAYNSLLSPLVPEGYILIMMDNRGTPVLKGTEFRMAVYKKLGVMNARDQAMAAKEILKWPFIDPERVAVHGWSGGGNMTLNLLFKYPEIYKTGVAVAAVTDQHFYDNIYTERFMGLPEEDPKAYFESSPANFAKNLEGNLLYIHGTGDDNVHYKNAEVLINKLVEHGKLFDLMIYPNRTHGISEFEGTRSHLNRTVTKFIKEHCPPGGISMDKTERP